MPHITQTPHVGDYVLVSHNGKRQKLKVERLIQHHVSGPKFVGVWGHLMLTVPVNEIIPATICSMCRMPVADGEPRHDHETD
jgi:hypothetical protein